MKSLPRIAILTALWLAACGSGSSDNTAGQESSLTVSFTDAAADEVETFEVEVSEIVLHRPSGADVSVLAKRTRVDFAQLHDVADLVTGGNFPTGSYSGMSITFDFANVRALITGQTTPATVVDRNGAPLTGAVPVRVEFPTANRPLARVGRNHLFELDLNLNDALTVDIPGNRIAFTPALSASVDSSAAKDVWRNGLLSSVDVASGTVMVERRAVDNSIIDQFTVLASPSTIYQVNGVIYIAGAGLAALAGLPIGTRVHATGSVDPTTRAVRAKWIEAGFGVVGNGQDWVEGLITARTGAANSNATLTVLGHSTTALGVRTYNTPHTVQVNFANTKVLRRGAGNSLNTDALNVGQRVLIFGALTGTNLDATASSGVAREILTSVYGLATGAPSNQIVTMNLVRIGLRPIAEFNWTVSGVPQANPAAFAVDSTGLATAGITAGSKLRAVGFVKSVGSTSPTPDWRAGVLVNHSNTAQILVARWPVASASALPTVTTSMLALDITGANPAVLEDGFSPTALTADPRPILQPAAAQGLYRIIEGSTNQVHVSFSTFSRELAARLAAGGLAKAVSAIVVATPSAQNFSAAAISVELR